MNASSESGECASVIVSGISMCVLDQADAIALYPVVDGVTFNRFETGVFDQPDEFCFAHFDFIVGFDGVTRGQLAAFSNRAVNIVCAVMQRYLSEALAEHDPVGLDM